MKRGLAVGAVLLGIVAVRGISCGPWFLGMTFVVRSQPDDMQGFLGGKPWVLEQDYAVRRLALAYRILNGGSFTEGEKKALIAVDTGDHNSTADWAQPPVEGRNLWTKAYAKVMGKETPDPPVGDATVPGTQWQGYAKCQSDAYAHAGKTLLLRAQQHPAMKAELAEWVNGQQDVFTNCQSPGAMPTSLLAATAPWLLKDRDYQIAAALFYQEKWKDAESRFQAIAADKASPWRDLGGYMVGRSLLREATLGELENAAFDHTTMASAEKQMQAVSRGGGSYAQPAREMLVYIGLRLHPGTTTAMLGDAIAEPDPHLLQDVTDLTYAAYGWTAAMNSQDLRQARKSELVDWVETIRLNQSKHAVERWKATHKTVWLAAALTLASRTVGAPDAEMLAAANAIPETSPAWPTVTLYRLRNAGIDKSNWPELLRDRETLIARHAMPSTVNEFTGLALAAAPTLEDFARLAPMDPAATNGEGEFYDTAKTPKPTMAGLPVNSGDYKRFEDDTARVLNEKLPLSTLVATVESAPWPKQLRFEAALAVWTRAVLLDKPEEAHRLMPILTEGEPGWKPWLMAYDAATTPEERKVTGLLAMMRFPSVRPYVQRGPGRELGFVGYSQYRDNWWCGAMDTKTTDSAAAPLPFMTTDMITEANREKAQLLKVGDAPTYFGNEALSWSKAHPKDSRNPDLMGFALRAMRNGCNLEASTWTQEELKKRLHARYPTSFWTKRYPLTASGG